MNLLKLVDEESCRIFFSRLLAVSFLFANRILFLIIFRFLSSVFLRFLILNVSHSSVISNNTEMSTYIYSECLG